MAVTIDLGDPRAPKGDVHSRVKDPVAYRLALQVMRAAACGGTFLYASSSHLLL
jgi:hypothetical protein